MRVPLQQEVARPLAPLRVADHHRHDVGLGVQDRQARLGQGRLGGRAPGAGAPPARRSTLEVAHRRARRAAVTAGGSAVVKMKPGAIAAHRVDSRRRGRDVAADAAEALGERALDHVDPVHHAVALGDAATALAVHADGVDLVEVGHRAVAVGEVADRRRSARRRRPSSRRSRTRPASAGRVGRRSSARGGRGRCGGRRASRSPTRARPRSSSCGSARRRGSGSPGAAGRWWRCRPRWRRSRR